jgi:hypothetical protein
VHSREGLGAMEKTNIFPCLDLYPGGPDARRYADAATPTPLTKTDLRYNVPVYKGFEI